MKQFNTKTIGVILSIAGLLFLSFGMSRKPRFSTQELPKSGNDTIFQNDSMFFVLAYDSGKLIELNLCKMVRGQKNIAGPIQEMKFFSNGRLRRFSAFTNDTIIDHESIYEEQILNFDANNRITDYMLLKDLKAICRGASTNRNSKKTFQGDQYAPE